MAIVDQLASSLGQRDEAPNTALAARIVKEQDKEAVEELVALLQHKSKDVQSDSIKVLYEVGEQRPALIAAYTPVFIDLLSHKNNRLQWGAMTALDAVATEKPALVHKALPQILQAADKGSVITKDHAVNILIKLSAQKAYQQDTFSLLLEQLAGCATNQLPMYAERALPVISPGNRPAFVATLTKRLPDIDKESRRKRVEQVIKKLSKQG
ncbi:hypothetical protein [Paraflavitalea pollutisoli]|uniref:hypothetical protein n=1 Tax=Paraflavitalea pollutisoli TaxID=3034143 RepID=UPI0023ECFE86|nr:hypothetical protein [Paraflavitalea sp. H1-2-19X]